MKTATKARIGLVAGLCIFEIFVGFFNSGAKPEWNESNEGISFGIESVLAQEQGKIEYKNTIRDQLDKNYYSGAIVTCDSALKDYPNDADFWYFKGFALAETKQFNKAIEAYKKAISIHVDTDYVVRIDNEESKKHFDIARENKKCTPDLAIKEYLIFQNLEPDNPNGFYEIAGIYFVKKTLRKL